MAEDSMRGVNAAKSKICFLDGEKGVLAYYGYDVRDLVEHVTFEETCYLLLHGNLPTKLQLTQFNKQLLKEREIPEEILTMISFFPKSANQLAALRTTISALGLFDRNADDISEEGIKNKSIQLIAKTSVLTAAIWRVSQGEKILESNKNLGIAGNFLYLLTGKIPEKEAERLFDKALTLHAEHGFNASTFSARVTIATLSDMYSAITTALGTLKGMLHGGANLAALEQFRKIEQTLGKNFSDEHIAKKTAEFVDSALAQKQKMMGIGHAVYKVKDNRAIILEKYASEFAAVNKTQLKIAREIEKNMVKKKNLFSNVDLFSGLIYTAMGIPSQVFISLFAMGRMPGWLAHIQEQLQDNKLIRPRAEYAGPELRKFIEISKR